MRVPWKATKSDREVVQALEDVYGKEVVQIRQPGFGGLLTMISSRHSSSQPRGSYALLESYATQPWVRAVVGKIAEGVASVEWQAFKAPGANAKDQAKNVVAYNRSLPQSRRRMRKQMEFEPLPTHQILNLMDSGNYFHEGYILAELTQVHQELVGEGFWLKERNGKDEPVALWNIPPVWIAQTPVPGTDIDFFTVRVDGVLTPIPATEMIWFQKPSALTPYKRGVGVGSALSDEMDIDEYTAKMIKQFMIGGAVPDIIVTADGLSPDSTKRLEEDWLQKSQGFWKRFKPYFLNKKVEVVKLTSSFKELQLDKLRTAQRDIIVHTWGVSPEIMGIVENSNRATIEGAFFQFSRWVLVPRLEFKRVTLQARLVPDFGDPSLVLDYISPVEEDREHVLKVMTARPDAFLIDEWREEAGRSELEGGAGKVFATLITTRYVTEHKPPLVPADPADPPVAGDPPPTPAPTGDVDEDAAITGSNVLNGAQVTAILDLIGRVASGELSIDSAVALMAVAFGIGEDTAREIIGDPQPPDPVEPADDDDEEGGVGTILAALGRMKKAGLLKQDDEAEDEEEDEERAYLLLRAARDAVDAEEVEIEMRPVIAATVLAFGEDVLTQSELSTVFDSTDPDVAEYLLNGYRTELQGVSDTTKDEIERVIRSGVLEGLTLGTIVAAVRSVFARARLTRSATIGRSGTVQSANFGTVAGFTQAGIPLKDWVSERDDLVRDTHVELDQQDPIPASDNFVSSSGASGPHPGLLGTAAEDVGCRCVVMPAGFVDGKATTLLDTEEKRTEAWKNFETLREPYEQLAIESLGAAFKRQESAVVAALKGAT